MDEKKVDEKKVEKLVDDLLVEAQKATSKTTEQEQEEALGRIDTITSHILDELQQSDDNNTALSGTFLCENLYKLNSGLDQITFQDDNTISFSKKVYDSLVKNINVNFQKF